MDLNTFVKLHSHAQTGGQAKLLIRSGVVKVNGKVETRNKKQLSVGDKIEIEGQEFTV